VREVRVVDSQGRRISGFLAAAFTPATGMGFTSLPRGDLAAAIHHALGDEVETIFDNTVAQLEQTNAGVDVLFEHGGARRFDLVVGADGLHSRVRLLSFGPASRFERYLGIKVAAFDAPGYRPRDELVYIMHTRLGQTVARFSMRGDRTMFLFIFADADASLPPSAAAQKAVLRRRFGHSGWECPRILDVLDAADDVYFDRVSQIEMGPPPGAWSAGRVTLVGDAASCVSLLGGQGSALAMIAGYLLAGELHRAGGDHVRAFAEYERRFGPFVAMKQRAARRFVGVFTPRSHRSIWFRNTVMRLLSLPLVAKAVASRGFTDPIALPRY
jgi:2-polyprenyl-6-methoxyphenol hydroxylase-like FAD-dependent oxidoreductase